MKNYFIVNPNAGKGKGLRLWNAARRYLNKKSCEYEVFFAAEPEAAFRTAAEICAASKDEKLVIFVIGGDGTLSEVVNGLKHPELVTLGYIPACVKYSYARSLKLKNDPKAVIKNYNSVNGSRVEAIDYGVLCCEGGLTRRFMNSAGIGFDAALCRRLKHSCTEELTAPGGIRGDLMLYRELLKELLFSKPVKGYILLDGAQRIEFNNLMFVSVHIHPYEYGFRFGSYADPKDGMLEICAVSCRSKLKMLSLLMRSRFSVLRGSSKVRLLQCREAHIHFDRECEVHADGELIKQQTDIDIRCVSQQLNMLR